MSEKLILAKYRFEKDKLILDVQRSFTPDVEASILLKDEKVAIVRIIDKRYDFDDMIILTNNYVLYLDLEYDEDERGIMPIDVELEKVEVRIKEEVIRDPDGDYPSKSVQLVFPIKKR